LNNIPFEITPYINCEHTRQLFSNANTDIGLSLSNSYISPKVFSIPRLGMINVHGEILPEYQNAQSVIWQLYNGSPVTGYTIHKIEKKIDAGSILYQEKFPIVFKKTLAETISFNCAEITKKATVGIIKFFGEFEKYFSNPVEQMKGNHYTTPSLRQFIHINRQFKRLRKTALSN
jgi:methionyl-tRNA formyltransferase